MRVFLISVFVCWSAFGIGNAQEVESVESFEASDVTLDDFLWTARPLIIFSDATADPRFGEQIELLASDARALTERDVVVITDSSPAQKSDIRQELRPRGFMIALLAKDGTVVFRKPAPWDVREISRAIDKLPLRKQEVAISRSVGD